MRQKDRVSIKEYSVKFMINAAFETHSLFTLHTGFAKVLNQNPIFNPFPDSYFNWYQIYY